MTTYARRYLKNLNNIVSLYPTNILLSILWLSSVMVEPDDLVLHAFLFNWVHVESTRVYYEGGIDGFKNNIGADQ